MSTRAIPFGKYYLLERVNVGGMAEVYKAKIVGVEGFEKFIAIKRILPAIAADEDFIRMFIDEAKITVQLNHANIAQTYELGKLNDSYFIAMEYVPGRDLRSVFDRLRKRNEVVPPELACYVVSRIAEGLDYAHRKRGVDGRELGIIHRDISPQNILCSYEGEVKLIDFGIAKAANKIMKTQAGILKGKFGYMSPEQVRGLPIDRRSDIFAVGIVLYEMLVGDRLFTGDSDYSILEKVRNANIPPPTLVRKEVPAALEKIVSRALAREPEDRYQHASELVADLQRWLLGQDRLFTREELSSFMKRTFAEEFAREKESLVESLSSNDETPTPPPNAESLLQSAPSLRPSSLRTDRRPKVEGVTAQKPSQPPPPPDDAFNSDPRASFPSPPRRLREASRSDDTDKVDAARPAARSAFSDDGDDEEPTNVTDPDGEVPEPPARRRPTSSDALKRLGDATDAADAPVKPPAAPARPPPPPPVASRPAPPRTGRTVPPPLNIPFDPSKSIPPRRRRPANELPFGGDDDDDDDKTQTAAPGTGVALPAGQTQPPQRKTPAQLSPVREPQGRPPSGIRAPLPKARVIVNDDVDDDEATQSGAKPVAYRPRRRARWELIPVAVLILIVVGWTAWKVADSRRTAEIEGATPGLPAASSGVAGLVVETDPADAQLLIDGRIVKPGGLAAYETDRLEADIAHIVVARKEGFREASATVTIPRGAARKKLKLTLRTSNPVVRLESTPAGALVSADDRELGRTPQVIATLPAGPHRFRFELKCYESLEREVVVVDGEQSVSVPLAERVGECVAKPVVQPGEPGLLRLVSRPVGAHVAIDGKDTGRVTPLHDFPIPPGTHRLRVSADGRTQEIELIVEAGRSITKVVVLR